MAVFAFAGEWFSLVYMVLNIAVLLFFMVECQDVGENISALCEDIIHLPTNSILGDLDSVTRTNMLMTLQREKAIPCIMAFGWSLSKENYRNVILVSLASIGSVVGNKVQELFVGITKTTLLLHFVHIYVRRLSSAFFYELSPMLKFTTIANSVNSVYYDISIFLFISFSVFFKIRGHLEVHRLDVRIIRVLSDFGVYIKIWLSMFVSEGVLWWLDTQYGRQLRR